MHCAILFAVLNIIIIADLLLLELLAKCHNQLSYSWDPANDILWPSYDHTRFLSHGVIQVISHAPSLERAKS
ncbi:uncharacterized protein P174DRAFT_442984 [Aspergillus novofumigatus IBT 16806]|uniref:Uncharacterized protein n=1 Tax=Aspergillus novofumigatus (strain IBT 16806) TaxID=1392255 RepID=A0A2I1C658_ASPN1|nr:uncharacterized protein P174DRAFT_442984 [Aspergillus novofumigatus IBT 16806]PKX93128.1 hypothetical protein P174DRAFT_442984 [Aspergillus novofumigatus IBT 16806]